MMTAGLEHGWTIEGGTKRGMGGREGIGGGGENSVHDDEEGRTGGGVGGLVNLLERGCLRTLAYRASTARLRTSRALLALVRKVRLGSVVRGSQCGSYATPAV